MIRNQKDMKINNHEERINWSIKEIMKMMISLFRMHVIIYWLTIRKLKMLWSTLKEILIFLGGLEANISILTHSDGYFIIDHLIWPVIHFLIYISIKKFFICKAISIWSTRQKRIAPLIWICYFVPIPIFIS